MALRAENTSILVENGLDVDAGVRSECKARVDSLYLIHGQALTGS